MSGAQVLAVIRMVVSNSVAKAFQSLAFQCEIERAAQIGFAEPNVLNDL